MKRILPAIVLGLFSAALLVGCEASAKVGDPDTTDSKSTSYKKTTTYEPSERTTKTEVKTETR